MKKTKIFICKPNVSLALVNYRNLVHSSKCLFQGEKKDGEVLL